MAFVKREYYSHSIEQILENKNEQSEMIKTSTKQNYQHKTLSSASLCTAAALVLGSYLFRSAVINWIVAALTLALVADLGFILLLEFTTRTHAGEDVRRVVARVWFKHSSILTSSSHPRPNSIPD